MSDDESSTARTIRLIKAEGFAAGYDKAVANLRDDERWAVYLVEHEQALYDEENTFAADYLEAQRDQP